MFVHTLTVSVIGIKHESEHIVLLSLLYHSSCCVYTAEKRFYSLWGTGRHSRDGTVTINVRFIIAIYLRISYF